MKGSVCTTILAYLLALLIVSPTRLDACVPPDFDPIQKPKTRADFIRQGLTSLGRILEDPPIPEMTQKVESVDQNSHQRRIAESMKNLRIKLPSGQVVGIRNIRSWEVWYKKFISTLIRMVKISSEEIPPELLSYKDEIASFRRLLPKNIPAETQTLKIQVDAQPWTRVEEALMTKWMQAHETIIPYPKQKPKPDETVVLVAILPGMALVTSGIESTFGWHATLDRLEKAARRQNKKVQFIPISIGYPFYGGPVQAKYFDLPKLANYVEETIQAVSNHWIAQGILTPQQVQVALMGRSTGGMLALWMHNRHPEKFPIVIAGSPMLSEPGLHLIPAEEKWRTPGGLTRRDAADQGLTMENLNVDLLNLSSSYNAQSYVETTLPPSGNERVLVVWSELDAEYPGGHVWQPIAIPKFQKSGIDPIVLKGATAHNNLSEKSLFDQNADVLLPRLLQVLAPE